MISEYNGVRNYKAARSAMLLLFIIFGVLAAIWLFKIIVSYQKYKLLSIIEIVLFISAATMVFGAMLPKYFKINHLSISEKDIVCVKGVINDRKIYLPMDAVKSVTMIITPAGEFTGMNAIIFNALGSRLMVLFLDRNDCEDICSFVNRIIMSREKSETMQDSESIPAKK